MNTLLAHLELIAQAAGQTPPAADPNAGGGAGAGGGNSLNFMLPVAIILMLGYFMLVRPEKKKQSLHKEMLLNLKKNDRVVTVGGIKGIVANVLREANEVTVTIDETTGTKIRVTLDSISRVEGGKSDKAEDEKK
ncbi:MAG: preprotein translocase subunit YajC [Planctomycetes bacterium]|nr:preprotein translocase subunit YajC [Planctomycetota bacterium]